jgi:exodeoxyribonuclease VII small subunit
MTDEDIDLSGIEIIQASDVPDGTPFEVAVAELEECVDRLESGDVGLDQALRLFRRGAALQAWCEARLDAIRATIEELAAEGPGAPPAA